MATDSVKRLMHMALGAAGLKTRQYSFFQYNKRRARLVRAAPSDLFTHK